MRTTVIHHSADYDGIFCREIAHKFLPDAELIGWNYGDAPVPVPNGQIYILDLSPDCMFTKGAEPDLKVWTGLFSRIIWIDHHKSAIEKFGSTGLHDKIPGYRIDGVAACRLAWQWFQFDPRNFPKFDKQSFVDRTVKEPLSVRLAGEYHIWDKRDPDAETFQYGLRFVEQGSDFWEALLRTDAVGDKAVQDILGHGQIAQTYQRKMDASLVKHKSFRRKWEGLDFLCLNTGSFNSLTFAALDKPETGHDALLGFMWNGKVWTVSLYHANHRKDLDLSLIAVKNGGGGHKGACGFTCNKIPFI